MLAGLACEGQDILRLRVRASVSGAHPLCIRRLEGSGGRAPILTVQGDVVD